MIASIVDDERKSRASGGSSERLSESARRGTHDAKVPARIMGGLVTLESDWKPALRVPLVEGLQRSIPEGRLDFDCVAAHGLFSCDADGLAELSPGSAAATACLFELTAASGLRESR